MTQGHFRILSHSKPLLVTGPGLIFVRLKSYAIIYSFGNIYMVWIDFIHIIMTFNSPMNRNSNVFTSVE